MRIRSVLVLVWCVCFSESSLAQSVYEVEPPDPHNCYYIDTYKTDVGPRDELVRSERSFFKKLFKKMAKANGECVQCCSNNGGAAVDYPVEEQYDNGYGPVLNPQDIPIGHQGHIYLPLPHPHRMIPNLFMRPFRLGYGGKGYPSGNYPPKAPPVEVKPELPPPPPPKPDIPDVYHEPAPVEPPTEAYGEEPSYPSEEKYEQKEEYVDKSDGDKKYEKADAPAPAYGEGPSYPSEEKYEQKEEYVDKSGGDKKYEKADAPAPAQAPAPAPAPVTAQVIQPIVPIIAPPLYIYPLQYYTPPTGQPYVYPSPPSPAAYPAATSQYISQPQATVSYPPPAPTYTQETLVQYQPPAPTYTPVTSAQPMNSPPALDYPTQDPIYSPPAPSYSQVSPPPTYTPPPVFTYSPLPDLEEPALRCPFLNPSDCGYYKKTYSTSLTYMTQQSPSPPPPPPPSLPSYHIPCYDQPMSSCPELFTSYQLSLQQSIPPVSMLC